MLMRNQQNGVTLIELIIAVVIVGIVTALALPSYSNWIQNTRLRNGAESVLNGLQLARVEAVKRNANVQFVLGLNTAWIVGCVNVVAAPAPPATMPAECPATIQSHSVRDGSSADVSMTMTAGANPVIFNNLGRLVTAETTWNVDNSAMSAADSRDLRIVVTAGGMVSMCDPNVVAPDSRAC
jgi:type IV fimbrial biogenesis protein FimT